MELKKGGPTKSIELRNIAQRTGPGDELAIVYSDKTGAYLLQVPNAFKAFLAQRQPSSGRYCYNKEECSFPTQKQKEGEVRLKLSRSENFAC